MPEKIPQFKPNEIPLSEQKENFSYWALVKDSSVAIKDIAQRKKALARLKEKGWESFEDFKAHGLKIDSIEKGSREKKTAWEHLSVIGMAEPKNIETIKGQIMLSGPLFGNQAKLYTWQAILAEESIGKNKSFFTLNLALLNEQKKEATYLGAEDIISPIEKNIKQNGLDVSFPRARSLGQEALRRALPEIFQEIKIYIWEKCYPEAAIRPEIANLKFKMDTEISRKVDEDREKEIVKGLKDRRFDEKIFYYGPGAAKFMEILKSPEYKLANIELELIKKHLAELAPYLQDRTIYDLGAANALKAIPLLEKQLETQEQADYAPIDINPAFVFEAGAEINNPKVNIEGKILDFTRPLTGKLGDKPKLLTLLGGTLGNGDQAWQQNLLRNLSQAMITEDALLIGAHLHEDLEQNLKMYDNPAGREFVMATVRNLGFPEDKITLQFVTDEQNRQIQAVIGIKENLNVKGVEFKDGEKLTIFISQKYQVGELDQLAQGAGLAIEKTFMDPKKQWELAVLRKK